MKYLNRTALFGTTASISPPAYPALSSQNPPGPAGGVPDNFGLGRGAAGPRGTTPAARARAELHACTGPDDAGVDCPGLGGAILAALDRATSSRLAGVDYSESLVRTWLSLCPHKLRHRDRIGHGCDRRR